MVNLIRNKQRNRRALDETNIALPLAMQYDSLQLPRLNLTVIHSWLGFERTEDYRYVAFLGGGFRHDYEHNT